jgi:hypothetical protein
MSTLSAQDVLLDPAINIAIAHAEELRQGAELADFGVTHLSEFTESLVLGDPETAFSTMSATITICLVAIAYALLAGRALGSVIRIRRELGVHPKVLRLGRAVLYYALFAFVAAFLFVAPGRTYVLAYAARMPRVDVSISGLEDITSRYYLIAVAEYDDGYAFYIPNLQDVVRVSKDDVAFIRFKEFVPLFADRFRFEKRPRLGVHGDWSFAETTVDAGASSSVPTITGFRVQKSTLASPAHEAGIRAGDVIRSVGGAPPVGDELLADIIARSPLDRPVEFVLDRDGETRSLQVQLVIQP